VNSIRSVQSVAVTADGNGVVTHAGSVLLGEVADKSGLTTGLSALLRAEGTQQRKYDLGRALVHLAISIADGGDCLSDVSVLRNQPEVFPQVPSDPTMWRIVDSMHSGSFQAIAAARRQARTRAWAAGMAPEFITLDFDATLIDAHSEKEDAKPNYKNGFGFHPLLCSLDETNEVLAAQLRPGNAGSNTASDHIELLDAAIAQLPEGHFPDLVRSDAAGATHDFVDALHQRGIAFSVGHPVDGRVRDALLLVQEEDWRPALNRDGTTRKGSWIVEITNLIDLSGWPEGSRMIARREHPHPGAQLSLFDQENEFRHQVVLTDVGGSAAQVEAGHRGHARVEDRIRCAKDTGLDTFPCADVVRNMAWLQTVLIAIDLLIWTQHLGFDGALRIAEPKRFRQRVLHVGARITTSSRRVKLRIQQAWPWSTEIAHAFGCIRFAFST
jgi:hypothetical protein